MKFARSSGILLHPTSLPGPFGIGDIGAAAREFCDLLSEAGQTWWQILPLGPTGFGDSPYQCFSAFAGNPLLISPEGLYKDGLLERDDLQSHIASDVERVDYGTVHKLKRELLAKAFTAFKRRVGEFRSDLDDFVRTNAFWLEDYALYQAIRDDLDHKPWNKWPDGLKSRETGALSAARSLYEEAYELEIFKQFVFFRQWDALKTYANEVGIRIIGDIPIFVAYDSADVWCNQDKFKLEADGSPSVVAGVPPDFFSKTGQLWGNPIYDWDAMAADGFKWWAARAYSTLQMVDVARIDHFRGFTSAWEVPGDDETAENGKWQPVPGSNLFAELQKGLGPLPFIAEDLGHLTPDVEHLRDQFGFPGMRILQFGFGGDARNRDLPHNFVANSVAYTGTHDNDTSVGWWESADKRVRKHALGYLHSTGKQIHWDMVRAIWASVADLAVVPMQDLLGLDNEARMNLPASQGSNWQWRMTTEQWTSTVSSRLRQMTEVYGRLE